MEREENLENRLISYINAVVGITNPAIFDGISDRMVITKDGRTQREFNESIPFWTDDYVNFKQETVLREEQILEHVQEQDKILSIRIDEENVRARGAEAALQSQINAVGVGNKAYQTYGDMVADSGNIPANSKVTVTNDSDATKNGDWQWDGTTFTKSAYDPASKAYADQGIKTFVSNQSYVGPVQVEFGGIIWELPAGQSSNGSTQQAPYYDPRWIQKSTLKRM